MNRPQRICLGIGLALIVLAGLVPPWVQVLDDGFVRSSRAVGHAWLFAPPRPEHGGMGVHLDYPRLGLVWLVTALASGGAALGCRGWRLRSEQERWPWPSIARWLYGWYLFSWGVLALHGLQLLAALAALGPADELHAWPVIDLAGVGLALALWTYAQLQFPADLRGSVRGYRAALAAVVALGGLGLLVGGAAGEPAVAWVGLARAASSGLFFSWVVAPMHRPRFGLFYRLFDHLYHRGVPLAFLPGRTATPIDPARPYTLAPDEPRLRIRGLRLLRGIAAEQVRLPADLRVRST